MNLDEVIGDLLKAARESGMPKPTAEELVEMLAEYEFDVTVEEVRYYL